MVGLPKYDGETAASQKRVRDAIASDVQDQFSQLPHASWRGTITLPILERSVRFAHEGTDHQIIYRNGVAVEMTGAGARVITYTIPFREGVTKGPYETGLFSSTLLRFWAAYHDDKSPGPLYDPIYGELTCVPQEWDETLDVSKRDGVDVRVSFKEHTEAGSTGEPAPPTLDSLQSDAVRLDEQVDSVDWEVQEDAPRATSDLFSQIGGLIQQGNYAVAKTHATIAEVTQRMREVEDAAAEAEANITSGAGFLRQDARKARIRAIRVANYPTRESATTTVRVARNQDTTIFAEAAKAGMPLQDFLLLNSSLARSTIIKAGTPFWVRRKRT